MLNDEQAKFFVGMMETLEERERERTLILARLECLEDREQEREERLRKERLKKQKLHMAYKVADVIFLQSIHLKSPLLNSNAT